MKPNLYLVNFSYANSRAVGGKRWRNFMPYCQNIFNEIFVLCDAHQVQEPLLIDGVQIIKFKNILHSLKVIQIPFIKGICYRLSLYLSKIFLSGNYFDISVISGKKMAFWLEKEFQDNPGEKIIIISVGPFGSVLPILQLKKKFPEHLYLIDYRDPWSGNTLAFGLKHLNPKRKQQEKDKEHESLQLADGVIGVEKNVFYQDSHSAPVSVPSKIIPNGFKWSPQNERAKNGDKIQILFAGTLYEDVEDLMLPLLEGLRQLKNVQPNLFSSFIWTFCGNVPSLWKDSFSGLSKDHFHFLGRLPSDEIVALFEQTNLGLNIVHRDFCYSKNTKFFEILGARKKTLYIGWPGETADAIVNMNIGFVWNPEISLQTTLEKIRDEWKANQLSWSLKDEQFEHMTISAQFDELTKFLYELR